MGLLDLVTSLSCGPNCDGDNGRPVDNGKMANGSPGVNRRAVSVLTSRSTSPGSRTGTKHWEDPEMRRHGSPLLLMDPLSI